MAAEPDAPPQVGRKSGWPELLASLTIVFVFLSLVLPAIGPAHRGPRRDSEVRVEIGNFENAIVLFKVTYGVEPPSGIVLYAEEAGWNQDRRSRGLIRQIWPKFDFATCGGMENVPAEGIRLNGAECLVFFLGGLASPVGGEMNGFSRNPTHPFSTTETAREGPFVEFKGGYSAKERRWIGRLVDQDRDGFPEYLDPLPGQTQPYLYANSGLGKGYRIEDLGGAMSDVYRDRNGAAFKPKDFQIISPGADGKYGLGGLFDPENRNMVLVADRVVERDNVTNFIVGTLGELSEPRTTILITLGIITLDVFLMIAVARKLRWTGWLSLLLFIVLGMVITGLVIPAIFSVS